MFRKLLQKMFPAAQPDQSQLSKRVADLSKEVAALRRLLGDHRGVDLVNFRELKIFMFTDDFGYRLQVHEDYKHYRLTADDILRTEQRREAARNPAAEAPPEELFGRANKDQIIQRVMAHYWKHGLDFVYLDVGCGYGISALSVACGIRSWGKNNKVICFEPGVAAPLVRHNIALNGLDDCVIFEPIGVSSGTFPMIMYCEAGQSQGNRIVNRRPDEESQSFVVETTSIDEYARVKGIRENMIVKIDTEGAEYEVIAGMQRVLQDRHVTYFVEFTPGAIWTRVPPAQFLAEIGRDSHLLDAGTLGFDMSQKSAGPFKLIAPSDCEAYAAEVTARPQAWTDLLVIPKALPGARELLEELA